MIRLSVVRYLYAISHAINERILSHWFVRNMGGSTSIVVDGAMVGAIMGGATGRIWGMQFETESATEEEIYGNLRDMGMVAGFWCGLAGGALVSSEGMCVAPEEEEIAVS